MNWLVIAVVGGAAAWFEYNYRRSQHQQKNATSGAPSDPAPVPQTARVAQLGEEPSISPGSENDRKLNTTA